MIVFKKGIFTLIEMSNFIENSEESDDRYICYNINSNIRIFNSVIEDQSLEDVQVFVARNIGLPLIIEQVIRYIDWINNCENLLKKYYENKLRERVYDTWFNDIEVYRVDITFNSEYDYGAIVYCGDRIFVDHALEIEFIQEEISDILLNG